MTSSSCSSGSITCGQKNSRTAATSPPTTTGKVERFHKTLRREFLDGKTFTCLADAQANLDAWVREYNFERPHQSLGMAVPWDRFALAASDRVDAHQPAAAPQPPEAAAATRRVGSTGLISFAGARYGVGVWLAGAAVTVVCDGGLVHLHHRGVVVATHARRHAVASRARGCVATSGPRNARRQPPSP
ncbi:MAG: transposase [Gemmatimonadetes bacterium]|nr:transposase [Gemmatimonadota bacterium]